MAIRKKGFDFCGNNPITKHCMGEPTLHDLPYHYPILKNTMTDPIQQSLCW